jgi:FO synthase
MGDAGVKACLNSGANDVGGTLMNESISRAAGTIHGQERHPEEMERMIEASGRYPKQRTTLYNSVTEDRLRISFNAAPLAATA